MADQQTQPMATTSEIIARVTANLPQSEPGAGWTIMDSGAGMVTVVTPAGHTTRADLSSYTADEAARWIGDASMRHNHDRPCPVTGREVDELIFTDHHRPGILNACKHCHHDHRTIGERLHDLESVRSDQ